MNTDQPRRPGLVLGWKEYVDFPDWHIEHVKVKIDTGARTSALDVLGYQLRQHDGMLTAELKLALNRRRPEDVRTVIVPVLRMVVVSNSSARREERPLIEVRVRIGPLVKVLPVTIANRAGMLFPMILGRKALAGDFVVDVSRKYALTHGSTTALPKAGRDQLHAEPRSKKRPRHAP